MSDVGYQKFCEKCGAPVVWCKCWEDIDWSLEMRTHIGMEKLGQQVKELCAELARLTAIIARLKEDGERLALGYEQVSREAVPYCVVCKKDAFSGYLGQIKHDDWCPVTLHRALMKELEC